MNESIQNTKRISMPELFMSIALLVKQRSICKVNQVGVVIAPLNLRNIYSFGYNGPVHGENHNICNGISGQCGCLHAEINALLKVQVKDSEKVMFTTTSPCMYCAKAIIQSGFSKIYYYEPYRDLSPIDYLKKFKIEVIQLKTNFLENFAQFLTK